MPRIPSDPVLRAVLLFLLLWPPLQLVGTMALDVSSWRFGGWGMYASSVPRRSHVAVMARDCALPVAATSERSGLRTLVFGDHAVRKTRLSIDARAGDLAQDISALRRPTDVIALDDRLRRLHGLDPRMPLVIAAVEPRIDTQRHVAFGFARMFVVANGAIVESETSALSLARIDALLPACEVLR